MSRSVTAKFLDFIEPRLNRRSVALLACLILSGLFWLLTSLSNEYQDELRFPIVYEGLPEDQLIVNNPEQYVSAEVKGFGFDILWHRFKFESTYITIPANRENLPKVIRNGKEFHYFLTDAKTGRFSTMEDQQLDVLDISPDTIFIQFKPKYIKEVPVRLSAEMTFAKQYGMMSQPILEPDSVLIVGPREQIDSIEFIITEPQTWLELSESVATEVPLRGLNNLPNVRLSHSVVEVELNVVEFTEGSVMVPLQVKAADPNAVQVFPSEVEIKYQVPLPLFDKVVASQFDVSVEINDQTKNNPRLEVVVDRQSEHVTQVKVNPSQVEFIIQR